MADGPGLDLVRHGLRATPRTADEAFAEGVADGIWRLDLPLPYPPGTVNAYLLEAAEGWILVDCGSGMAPGWDALEQAIRAAGVDPAGVVQLVGTHAHLDHTGLAAEVVDRTGCAYLMAGAPEPVIDAIREPSLPAERRRAMAREAGIPEEELDWALTHPGQDVLERVLEPHRLLREDDAIETRSGRWRVLQAPGHAASQVVLLAEQSRFLLSADLVYIGRIPYLENDYTPDPYAEHLDSLERVRALEPTLVLPGHGPTVAEASGALDAAHGSLLRAKARIAAAVAERPMSAWEVVDAVLQPGATFQMRQAALAGAICILRRLEAEDGATSELDELGVRLYQTLV